MKHNIFLLGTAFIAAVAFTACDTENKGEVYNQSGAGVSFISSKQTESLEAGTSSSFTVEVLRADNAEAGKVALSWKASRTYTDEATKKPASEDASGYFTIPAEIEFEAGAYKSDINVQIGNILSGESYVLELSLPETDASLGGVSTIQVSISKDYTYTDWADGQVATFISGYDNQPRSFKLQKADRATWYKAVNMYEDKADIILKVDKDGNVTVDEQYALENTDKKEVYVSGRGTVSGTIMELELVFMDEDAKALGTFTERITLPAVLPEEATE